ncbi:MAG: CDP-alcohol phosphatidyltransferase family protein [Deltaproteobacteria bacterium]|nr:CDP-alcohol phosphatidyltransferase family protein [Deltaproteobacteria bacterium]
MAEHSPDAICQPWLALGFLLYWILAVSLSLGSFFHRLPPAPLTRAYFGQWLREMLSPFERVLIRQQIPPNLLSYAQLSVSLLAGLAYAKGVIFLGGWLVLESGVLDLLDGGIARSTGQANRRGAFIDSVVDRYAEFFTYLGLGVFFAFSWVFWAVVLAFLGSIMVSYVRARAEGLGVSCQVGVMQRAERYLLLGGGSMLSTTLNHLLCLHTHMVLIVCLVILVVLANVTAIHRIFFVATSLRKA